MIIMGIGLTIFILAFFFIAMSDNERSIKDSLLNIGLGVLSGSVIIFFCFMIYLQQMNWKEKHKINISYPVAYQSDNGKKDGYGFVVQRSMVTRDQETYISVYELSCEDGYRMRGPGTYGIGTPSDIPIHGMMFVKVKVTCVREDVEDNNENNK